MFGQKSWLILPPGEEEKLKDGLKNLPFSISKEMLDSNNVKYFDLIQESGETIFIPSGWFHQVQNTEDAMSVNHNWFNGCNIAIIVDNLLSHFKDVEREIADCKDMENFDEHCQLMLRSSFGMNFFDLFDIIEHIANKRVKFLRDGLELKSFDSFTFGRNHIIWELKAIQNILKSLLENEDICKFREIVDELNNIQAQVNDEIIGK